MMRQANPNYMGGVGDDPATNVTPLRTSVDLSPVSFGSTTFTNPCFWILVGIAATITIQWFMHQQRRGS